MRREVRRNAVTVLGGVLIFAVLVLITGIAVPRPVTAGILIGVAIVSFLAFLAMRPRFPWLVILASAIGAAWYWWLR
jgi:hypothetical protein